MGLCSKFVNSLKIRDMKTPEIIENASKTPYISIGVKFGGVILNGKEYVYLAERDAFILRSCLKKEQKAKKRCLKIEQEIIKNVQKKLFEVE